MTAAAAIVQLERQGRMKMKTDAERAAASAAAREAVRSSGPAISTARTTKVNARRLKAAAAREAEARVEVDRLAGARAARNNESSDSSDSDDAVRDYSKASFRVLIHDSESVESSEFTDEADDAAQAFSPVVCASPGLSSAPSMALPAPAPVPVPAPAPAPVDLASPRPVVTSPVRSPCVSPRPVPTTAFTVNAQEAFTNAVANSSKPGGKSTLDSYSLSGEGADARDDLDADAGEPQGLAAWVTPGARATAEAELPDCTPDEQLVFAAMRTLRKTFKDHNLGDIFAQAGRAADSALAQQWLSDLQRYFTALTVKVPSKDFHTVNPSLPVEKVREIIADAAPLVQEIAASFGLASIPRRPNRRVDVAGADDETMIDTLRAHMVMQRDAMADVVPTAGAVYKLADRFVWKPRASETGVTDGDEPRALPPTEVMRSNYVPKHIYGPNAQTIADEHSPQELMPDGGRVHLAVDVCEMSVTATPEKLPADAPAVADVRGFELQVCLWQTQLADDNNHYNPDHALRRGGPLTETALIPLDKAGKPLTDCFGEKGNAGSQGGLPEGGMRALFKSLDTQTVREAATRNELVVVLRAVALVECSGKRRGKPAPEAAPAGHDVVRRDFGTAVLPFGESDLVCTRAALRTGGAFFPLGRLPGAGSESVIRTPFYCTTKESVSWHALTQALAIQVLGSRVEHLTASEWTRQTECVGRPRMEGIVGFRLCIGPPAEALTVPALEDVDAADAVDHSQSGPGVARALLCDGAAVASSLTIPNVVLPGTSRHSLFLHVDGADVTDNKMNQLELVVRVVDKQTGMIIATGAETGVGNGAWAAAEAVRTDAAFTAPRSSYRDSEALVALCDAGVDGMCLRGTTPAKTTEPSYGLTLSVDLERFSRYATAKKITNFVRSSSMETDAEAAAAAAVSMDSFNRAIVLITLCKRVTKTGVSTPAYAAWLPLVDPQTNHFVANGERTVPLHRVPSGSPVTPSLNPDSDKIMSDVWREETYGKLGRDTLTLTTSLCSTHLTQEPVLHSLLSIRHRMRQVDDAVVVEDADLMEARNVLERIKYVPMMELVRFLRPTLDTLFGLLDSKEASETQAVDAAAVRVVGAKTGPGGRRGKAANAGAALLASTMASTEMNGSTSSFSREALNAQIFDTILYITKHLTDDRSGAQLETLLTHYIENDFKLRNIYRPLLQNINNQLRAVLESSEAPDVRNSLRDTFSCLPHMFKLMSRSYRCHKQWFAERYGDRRDSSNIDANYGSVLIDFMDCICRFLTNQEQVNNAILKAALFRSVHGILDCLYEVFQPEDLAKQVTSLVDVIASDNRHGAYSGLAGGSGASFRHDELYFLLQLVRSDVFTSSVDLCKRIMETVSLALNSFIDTVIADHAHAIAAGKTIISQIKLQHEIGFLVSVVGQLVQSVATQVGAPATFAARVEAAAAAEAAAEAEAKAGAAAEAEPVHRGRPRRLSTRPSAPADAHAHAHAPGARNGADTSTWESIDGFDVVLTPASRRAFDHVMKFILQITYALTTPGEAAAHFSAAQSGLAAGAEEDFTESLLDGTGPLCESSGRLDVLISLATLISEPIGPSSKARVTRASLCGIGAVPNMTEHELATGGCDSGMSLLNEAASTLLSWIGMLPDKRVAKFFSDISRYNSTEIATVVEAHGEHLPAVPKRRELPSTMALETAKRAGAMAGGLLTSTAFLGALAHNDHIVWPHSWTAMRVTAVTQLARCLRIVRVASRDALLATLLMHVNLSTGKVDTPRNPTERASYEAVWVSLGLPPHLLVVSCWRLAVSFALDLARTTVLQVEFLAEPAVNTLRCRFGDVREAVFTQLALLWHDLAECKVLLFPWAVTPLVRAYLTPSQVLRRQLIGLLHNALLVEHAVTGAVSNIEVGIVEGFDLVVRRSERVETRDLIASAGFCDGLRCKESMDEATGAWIDIFVNQLGVALRRMPGTLGSPDDKTRSTQASRFLFDLIMTSPMFAYLQRYSENDRLYEHERTEALLRLAEYLAKTGRTDTYASYLRDLYDLHDEFGNHVEAGSTLERLAHITPWEAGRDAGGVTPEQIKVKIDRLKKAADHFVAASAFEDAIRIHEMLLARHRLVTYDMKAAAETARVISDLLDKTLTLRVVPETYMLCFVGAGWPKQLANTRWLTRTQQRIKEFGEMMQRRYADICKSVTAERRNEYEDEVKRNPETCILQIITVDSCSSPAQMQENLLDISNVETEIYPPAAGVQVQSVFGAADPRTDPAGARAALAAWAKSDGVRRRPVDHGPAVTGYDGATNFAMMPATMQEYYSKFHVDLFMYSRSGLDDPSWRNTAWERAHLNKWLTWVRTLDMVPHLSRFTRVVEQVTTCLGPIETAIDVIAESNAKLAKTINEMDELLVSRDYNVDAAGMGPLSMVMSGQLDAAINGGPSQYLDFFFVPNFWKPDGVVDTSRKQRVERLEMLLKKMIELWGEGLRAHGATKDTALDGFQKRLQQLFDQITPNFNVAFDPATGWRTGTYYPDKWEEPKKRER